MNGGFLLASPQQWSTHIHDLESRCPWKGTAGYFDVSVDGQANPGAAWFYDNPKPGATEIAGRVAFWRGVQIEA